MRLTAASGNIRAMMSSNKSALKASFLKAREDTLRLAAMVDDRDLSRSLHKEFSPLRWHIGHIGMFEAFWVLQQTKGDPSLSKEYDFLFDPTQNPKPERINLPAREKILDYLRSERQNVFEFLDSVSFETDNPLLKDGFIFHMVLEHEYQHQETMTLILQMIDPAKKKRPKEVQKTRKATSNSTEAHQRSRMAARSSDAPESMVLVPAGPFLLGSGGPHFVYDNEKLQHQVVLKDFFIDIYPVSNGAFLRFIMEGGYQERSLWTEEGWNWKEERNVTSPRDWMNGTDGRWFTKEMFGLKELQPDRPVVGVSWYEATAYGNLVGKRLPTEAEWEKAASWDSQSNCKRRYPWGNEPPSKDRSNFGGAYWGTTPVGMFLDAKSSYGCLDVAGNVWEWTTTVFQGYPGFKAFPYRGYSEEWFDGKHKVLRGGSWATQGPLLRSSLRNWYHPFVREIFAGFRCAKDA
ncbi:MAG: SUMF1/EgtB/PvdO family nonheme iron enzyme [Bacteroidota bacterium]